MKDGYRIIDSDFHLVEPPDLWKRYLPAEYRDRAPVGPGPHTRKAMGVVPPEGEAAPRVALSPKTDWQPELHAHMATQGDAYDFAEADQWNAKSQLDAMDQEGIDIGVLFPTRGLFVLGYDVPRPGRRGLEPPYAAALARAYNDWLGEFASLEPSRLVGIGMVAPHDVDAAVAETRRCVEQLGFRGIFLLPGLVNERLWCDPAYDPLWRECQEMNVPVCFHGGGPDELTDYGIGHESSFMMWHTFSHCLGPMAALVQMCAGGVFDRFPSLRAAFLEANCSWAPWLLHRLDEHYDEYTGRFAIDLKRQPSEYLLSNCWVAVEADEAPATLYVQTFGDDNVVFSTDYPHPDSKFPHAVEAFLAGNLTAESKRKFLWDNCVRLYDLQT
jgi:predicted TIM-barrel fold metal-dependent hydrolase